MVLKRTMWCQETNSGLPHGKVASALSNAFLVPENNGSGLHSRLCWLITGLRSIQSIKQLKIEGSRTEGLLCTGEEKRMGNVWREEMGWGLWNAESPLQTRFCKLSFWFLIAGTVWRWCFQLHFADKELVETYPVLPIKRGSWRPEAQVVAYDERPRFRYFRS